MSAYLDGFDQYSGSTRRVTIARAGGHVLLTVEATSGANAGEVLLAPEQARAVGEGLRQQARYASEASELAGTVDVAGGEISVQPT